MSQAPGRHRPPTCRAGRAAQLLTAAVGAGAVGAAAAAALLAVGATQTATPPPVGVVLAPVSATNPPPGATEVRLTGYMSSLRQSGAGLGQVELARVAGPVAARVCHQPGSSESELGQQVADEFPELSVHQAYTLVDCAKMFAC